MGGGGRSERRWWSGGERARRVKRLRTPLVNEAGDWRMFGEIESEGKWE